MCLVGDDYDVSYERMYTSTGGWDRGRDDKLSHPTGQYAASE